MRSRKSTVRRWCGMDWRFERVQSALRLHEQEKLEKLHHNYAVSWCRWTSELRGSLCLHQPQSRLGVAVAARVRCKCLSWGGGRASVTLQIGIRRLRHISWRAWLLLRASGFDGSFLCWLVSFCGWLLRSRLLCSGLLGGDFDGAVRLFVQRDHFVTV